MAASILAIGTAVPALRLRQQDIRDLFAAQPHLDRITRRLVSAAFDAADIDHRHTVLADLGGDPTDLPVITADGRLLSPTTGQRNEHYRRLAPALFAEAGRRALEQAGMPASAVTHVITVSCTGLFAPGPDFTLVRDLALDRTVERYHLGFIGCAAALPGLRAAARITAAQPDAVVLVVCAELCSLHLRVSDDPQQVVAASVFADGAAAAVVAGPDAVITSAGPHLDLDRFATTITNDGESDMVWTVGDAGFEMTLSAEVPRIIGREIRDAVAGFHGGLDAPDAWAVHPGGRSILDRVEQGLDLDASALDASRRVLREYGNMSSATILFILRDMMLDEALGDGARIAALAFGPGLTVESALLTRRAGVSIAELAEAEADLMRRDGVPV